MSHKSEEHGSLPSVKGPGHTQHDATELCDTYDHDGNGDDLCPAPTTTTTTTQPTTTTTQPIVPPVTTVTERPPATTVAVVPSGPVLAATGAGTDAMAGLGLTIVFVGTMLVRWAR